MIAANRPLSWQRPYTATENVWLEDMVGLDPAIRAAASEALGSKPGSRPARLLLCGLSGNGKTMLAQAIANELGAAMFAFTPAEVTVRMNNSPEMLREVFEAARCYESAVILMEDADQSFSTPSGRALLPELRRQLKIPAEKGCRLVFITTTARPWRMPRELLAIAGKRIHLPMPDARARKALLEQSLKKLSNPKPFSLAPAIWLTRGFTHQEMTQICQRAAREAIRRAVANGRLNENITRRDVHKAIRSIQPETKKDDVKRMKRFARQPRRRQGKGSQGNHSPEPGIPGGGAPWQVWTESNTAPAA